MSEPVVIVLRVPPALKMMLERYAYDNRMLSLNRAVIELLETHPVVAEQVRLLYDKLQDHQTTGAVLC